VDSSQLLKAHAPLAVPLATQAHAPLTVPPSPSPAALQDTITLLLLAPPWFAQHAQLVPLGAVAPPFTQHAPLDIISPPPPPYAYCAILQLLLLTPLLQLAVALSVPALPVSPAVLVTLVLLPLPLLLLHA